MVKRLKSPTFVNYVSVCSTVSGWDDKDVPVAPLATLRLQAQLSVVSLVVFWSATGSGGGVHS